MKTKTVCIIIPVHDSADDFSMLISKIFDQQAHLKSYHLTILVIDDGSSAQINSTLKSLQGRYPDLYILDRDITDLEEAYKNGMSYANDQLKADITIKMNAFLRNNPGILYLKIRLDESREFIKYAVVGASGALVNMGLLIILTRYLLIAVEYASPVAIETAIISNFILNNIWTFKNRSVKATIIIRFIRFHMVALIAGFVNYIVLLALVFGVGLVDVLANIIGIASAMIVNYALNSSWTWRRYYA